MFTAAVEEIFKRIPSETGININGQVLNNLRFAGDIILFANTEEQLQELLKQLNEVGKKTECERIKRRQGSCLMKSQ